jgi:hypothetical protein
MVFHEKMIFCAAYFLSRLTIFVMCTGAAYTQYPVCFLYSKRNQTYFLTKQLFLLPFEQLPSCFPHSLFQNILCSLPHTFCDNTFLTSNPIAFCATYSMALCSDAFPYAFLSSIPLFFLWGLLNSSLVVFSLLHFYAAYPSPFCAAFSMVLCVPSLMHF